MAGGKALVQFAISRFHRQFPALRHGIAGIDREIENDLFKLPTIGLDETINVFLNMDQFNIFLDEVMEHLLHLHKDLTQV